MEFIPGFLKGAKVAYDSRTLAGELWNSLMIKLKGRKATIVFTGLPGAGKTQLLDRLTGKTEKADYVPPGRSARVEKAGKKISKDAIRDEPKKRLAYVVIPGQSSTVRQKALEELFSGKTPVAGVVHVVSSGLTTLRTREAMQILKEHDVADVAAYRQYQIQQEVENLDETCKAIERYMVATHKPVWLFIVATKIDLFFDTLDQDLIFYEQAGGPFAKRLRQLQDRVGSLNFDWELVAVSAWNTDFNYNGEKLTSQMKPEQQKEYLETFLQKMIAKS
jgi:GTPase SAR1 family protein